MRNLLVAFDGSFYSEAALNYAIRLAKVENARITGVFLEDVTAYHQFSPIFEAPEIVGLGEDMIQELKQENRQTIQENVKRFSDSCTGAGVAFTVEQEAGIPSRQLINESLFADCLLIGSVTYFSNIAFTTDASLLNEVLHRAHCPVIVVPETARDIGHVLFTYDGSPHAVYAIREFLHLFPNALKLVDTTLLTVVASEDDRKEGVDQLLQYLKLYLPDIKRERLVGKTSNELLHFAELSNDALVVIGGYGRNAFSRLFKASVSRQLVDAKAIPVFVAHE